MFPHCSQLSVFRRGADGFVLEHGAGGRVPDWVPYAQKAHRGAAPRVFDAAGRSRRAGERAPGQLAEPSQGRGRGGGGGRRGGVPGGAARGALLPG